ncbi:hypothetical protein ACHQM5_011157 [Ranunculus cassubicifolius]
MDTSASAGPSKRQKVVEEHNNDKNEDRISELPENILHYLLSFLPTKYALGTSVLSKRWRFLWTSVHNLDMSDRLLYRTPRTFLKKKRAFIKFVDRVLCLNDVSSIQKVTLLCWECDVPRLNEWISKIVCRKVQELDLAITFKDSYVYSHSLLTSESLKILKIDSTDIIRRDVNEVSIHIPSWLCSYLKVLHLKDNAISGGQLMDEVSLSFPVLEEFVMENCRWIEIKSVKISAPKLQMLVVREMGERDLKLHDCVFKFYAESVTSLKFKSYPSYKYYFHSLPVLVDVSMYVSVQDYTVNCVGTLFRQISNVKNLELSAELTTILQQPDFSVHLFPLSNLTHMTVNGKTGGMPVSGKSLIDLLSYMPSIESLRFPEGLDSFTFKGQGRIIGKTPQFFVSHLKSVEIRRFSGKENEQWFIKFLVKSAQPVNKLSIKIGIFDYVPGWSDEEKKEKLTIQLEMLARQSNPLVEFSVGYT